MLGKINVGEDMTMLPGTSQVSQIKVLKCPACLSEEVQKDCVIVGRQRYKCNHLGHMFFTDDGSTPIPQVIPVTAVNKEDKPMVLKIEDLPRETLERAGLDNPDAVERLASGTVVELKPKAGAAGKGKGILLPAPEKPRGVGPTILGRWYDEHRHEIEGDIAGLGEKETLKRWGICPRTWGRISARWESGRILKEKSKPVKTGGKELTREEKKSIAHEADKRGVKAVARERGLDPHAVQAWRMTYCHRLKGYPASLPPKPPPQPAERHVTVHVHLGDAFPKFSECHCTEERVEWLRVYRDLALEVKPIALAVKEAVG